MKKGAKSVDGATEDNDCVEEGAIYYYVDHDLNYHSVQERGKQRTSVKHQSTSIPDTNSAHFVSFSAFAIPNSLFSRGVIYDDEVIRLQRSCAIKKITRHTD